MNKLFIAILLLSVCLQSFGQNDTSVANPYEGLSLKDLLKLKIVSVSKNAEFLFDAPLSASVVTRDDIRRAGAASIMEALRLVPGMIVREQSNGNYDIHLRGLTIPPNSTFEGNSTTVLVMIDGRPIYSHLKGGTLWETLPVDINDVEKIEVIRGPAAALYGPNAVNGVINIITRQVNKDGLYLLANSMVGNLNTTVSNASIGFRSKQWSAIVSGNYQRRDRSQTSYFEILRDSLMELPEYFLTFLGDTNTTRDLYPTPELAMKKYAGNVFFNYSPAEGYKFNLAAGSQHSMAQRVSTENTTTPLSTSLSDSRYLDFRATLKGLSAQVSYIEGTQIVEYFPGNKYDFSVFDFQAEYNFIKNNFSIKPGISYKNAIDDDTKYSDIVNRTGMFNARGQITTHSASLRAEQKLFDNKMRLVAGIAASKFNYPDTTYLSYEFAATYKLSSKHLLRAVYSRAPRAATVYDTYVDQRVVSFETGDKKFTELTVQGNKNLKLLIADMFEVGYRGSISSRFYIDVELFSTRSKNYNSMISNRQYTRIENTDTIAINPLIPTNLPLVLLQQGVTISASYSIKKMQIKPFVTLQQISSRNYAPFLSTPDAGMGLLQNDDPERSNLYSGIGQQQRLKSTPGIFGGASINYMPCSKWNLNLTAYYTGAQTSDHFSYLVFGDGVRGIDHIKAKMIVNANVSYEAAKGLRFFWSGKNLLNDSSREFFRTDEVPFMMLGGVNFQL